MTGDLPEFELLPSQLAEQRQKVRRVGIDQWRRNLGITVRLCAIHFASQMREAVRKAIDYDLALAVWLGIFLDPTTFWIVSAMVARTARAR
jgi:ABC-type oligopeptide transport system substrate-binding subunit